MCKRLCRKIYTICTAPNKREFVLILLAFASTILLLHIQNIINKSLQVFDQYGVNIKWLGDKSLIYLQESMVGIIITVIIVVILASWFSKIKGKGDEQLIVNELKQINQNLVKLNQKTDKLCKKFGIDSNGEGDEHETTKIP